MVGLTRSVNYGSDAHWRPALRGAGAPDLFAWDLSRHTVLKLDSGYCSAGPLRRSSHTGPRSGLKVFAPITRESRP
jgi:hypothetical protein